MTESNAIKRDPSYVRLVLLNLIGILQAKGYTVQPADVNSVANQLFDLDMVAHEAEEELTSRASTLSLNSLASSSVARDNTCRRCSFKIIPAPVELKTANDVLNASLAFLETLTPGQLRRAADLVMTEDFSKLHPLKAALLNPEGRVVEVMGEEAVERQFAATAELCIQCVKSIVLKEMPAESRWYTITRGANFSGVVLGLKAFNDHSSGLAGEPPCPGKKAFATKRDAIYHWMVAFYGGDCKIASFNGPKIVYSDITPRYAYQTTVVATAAAE